MVARKFLVEHGASAFDLDYDTDDGLEVLLARLFPFPSRLWIPQFQKVILYLFDSISGAQVPALLSYLHPSRSTKGAFSHFFPFSHALYVN